MPDPIVRIAARGDGVTASGRHVQFAVPGDRLLDDGRLEEGLHHQMPPCRHYPECGGCQLQHADDETYCAYLVARIETALAQHGLSADIRSPHLSPQNSRRRATLRALKLDQGAVLGFNAQKSHRIVDMHECHILRPELFELVSPLRQLLAQLLRAKRTAEVQLTLVDQGADVLLSGVEAEGLNAVEQLTRFAGSQHLARLSIDKGRGPETFFEPVPVTVTLSGSVVPFPVRAFLQATADGEAALVESVRDALSDARRTADLFSGLGTFALALPTQVYAAEASRDAVLALQGASPQVAVEHRDLYRRPLAVEELNRFDGIVLDPPRAGASEQVERIAASNVPTVAYVSCNPATFARDARTLGDGGYRLQWVKPVGQFRWSTHVELVSSFGR